MPKKLIDRSKGLPKIGRATKALLKELPNFPAPVEREHYFNQDFSLALQNEVKGISITASTSKELMELYNFFKEEGLIEFVRKLKGV